MSDKQVTVSQSSPFISLLTVAFIVLKLTGVVSWPWWVVLAPLWGSVALFVVILIILAIVCAVVK